MQRHRASPSTHSSVQRRGAAAALEGRIFIDAAALEPGDGNEKFERLNPSPLRLNGAIEQRIARSLLLNSI